MYLLVFLLSCIPYNHHVQSAPQAPTLSWSFETLTDEMDIPRTTIYLVVDGNKTLIGKGTGEFRELEKDSFDESQYQIPKNALSACTGFWAGLAHHFCVIQSGKVLMVKQGYLDAESPKGSKVKYKTVKKIKL
jgi:hypothetical protein